VTFAFVTVFVALWSGFYFAWQFTSDAALALVFVRCFSASAVIIPAVYFHFATKLTGREHRTEVRLGYLLSVPFVPLSFTPWIVTGVRAKLMFPFWPDPGPLYGLYLAVFFYFLLRSWQILYLEYRSTSFIRKNQLRYVLAYTVVGFIGGATNFPLWYNVPVLPVGNALVGAYMVGVGYAVIRFRLMEFDLLAARIIAYGTMIAALAAGVPLMLRPLALLTRQNLLPLYLVTLVATGALFWIIPWARRRVDAFLEQRVLGSRLPDRALLRGLAAKISSATDEAAMLHEVVHSLADALTVRQVAVYTRTEFESDFTRRAATGGPAGAELATFHRDALLIGALQASLRGIMLDEAVHENVDERRNYFSALRRKQGMEVAVPIVGDTFFYGLITLGARADFALYNDVDISLLEAIGLQIGLNLRARQLERRASQTEKLISLGTLAAGLAHELRNPLVSIQTFSALLKERGTELDFQQEFSAVVQRDVNRIVSIVENVGAFAESNKVQMTAVNLGEVLRAAAEIVRPELLRNQVDLMLPAGDGPPVMANYSQLLQVFLNLIQNGVQAMEGRPGSCLTAGVELRGDAPQPLVCVTVADNGPGIEAAILPHIFEPFITTKSTGERRGKQGMGLGLAIVKRIIQHHHGEIRVASTPGRGTTFHVYLPPAP
jgi:two-component system nitrogen regulation sensor histidine kinase GlnL